MRQEEAVAMIYEWRVYTAGPGKFEQMKQRFVDHTARIFPRHGIALLGVFESREQDDRLFYLTAHEDEAARDKAWNAFKSDPEWVAIKTASETEGPLLLEQSAITLTGVIPPAQVSPAR